MPQALIAAFALCLRWAAVCARAIAAAVCTPAGYGVLACALLAKGALGWPDGAPCFADVMRNMYPSSYAHEGGERPDKVPYVIDVSHTCYSPQKDLVVTLGGVSRDWRFKGFMLQARDPGSTSGFGEFVRDDNGSWKYQCYDVRHAITHSHNTPKFKLRAYWQFNKRQRAHGNVQFIATVVADKQNYWVQQVRSIIVVPCRQGNESSHRGPFDVRYPEPVKRTTLPPLRVHQSRLIARSSGLRYGQPGTSGVDEQRARAFDKTTAAGDHDDRDFVQAQRKQVAAIRHVELVQQPVVPGCRDRLPECQSWYPFCNVKQYAAFLAESCAHTCNLCTRI